MSEQRQIRAAYDDEGIFVYQAFKPSIVKAALLKGTFGQGFNMARMTWIKPSFAWMLYRSGYASKIRQEAILKIKLSHRGFLTILSESVETSYNSNVYSDIDEWRKTLKKSPVRHQWDPERYLTLGKHPTHRAIQIGIRGWVVEKYVSEWIISLEEMTELAHEIKFAKEQNHEFPSVPQENVYEVDHELAQSLGIGNNL